MTALIDDVEVLICDLDGVVYAGARALAHAVEALSGVSVPVVYATNNASRTPTEVTEHLRGLGVSVQEDHVLTSSLAAARELARTLPQGAPVLAVGGEGVSASLRAVGLTPRRPGDGHEVVAVVQGYGPSVTASDLAEAAHTIRAGARWVATNDDLTLPTERGPVPGNGSLVAAVRQAVEVDPQVIGKPHPPMYSLAARLVGVAPERALALGDRLETDIAGAVATGMSGALVLTGVHGPVDAAAAPRSRRPTHVLSDLRDLARPYPPLQKEGGWCIRGGARARCATTLEVYGEGIDATRACLDALWEAVDASRITAEDAGRLMSNR